MGWQQGTGWGVRVVGERGISANFHGDCHVRQVYNHTHTCIQTYTLVQTTRGHTETTTCTHKHHPHRPSQVVLIEKFKKKKRKRGMSASVHSSVDVARKNSAAFIACIATPDPAWKAKNQQFSNRSKRFFENVCYCKTCLHALLAHAGIHSLIAETTKIVYSTEYLVSVCSVNHNCKFHHVEKWVI